MKPLVPRRLLVCACLLAAAPAWTAAQELGLARESAVKAAFLFKFAGFVEWPPGTFRNPSDPFIIGVFGDEAVASELEQLTRGRTVEGHPVAVLRVRGADDLGPLHMLFAGGSREGRVRDVLAATRGPVLTVTDASLGGPPRPVLQLTHEDGRVRFNASLAAADARNLKLSSRLLAVAQHVEGR